MPKKTPYTEGLSAQELFQRGEGITFDDFIMYPGVIIFDFDQINLETRLTREINLKRGLVSSPMDTVTEAEMAIALGLEGGIGFIHYNNTIEEQVAMVKKVKEFGGFITSPTVLSPKHTVADLRSVKEGQGFSSVPITQDGTLETKIVGLVTKRHTRYDDPKKSLGQIMRRADDEQGLATVPYGITLQEAHQMMKEKMRKRLLIVDDNGLLKALVTAKDLDMMEKYPHATIDKSTGKLMVCAAVSTALADRDRIDALADTGVDLLCIDTAQAAKHHTVKQVEYIDHKYDRSVIVGNIATIRQAEWLYEELGHAIAAFKVGMGVGRICTTQDTAGVGAAQLSAVYRIKKWLVDNKIDIPIMADGGIDGSGDIVKAYAVGADTIMAGGLFAGTREAPGEFHYVDGVLVKTYRGMGSIDAQKKRGTFRYLTEAQKTTPSQQKEILVSQGVSGYVRDKGSMHQFVQYLAKAIGIGFEDLGVQNIKELQQNLYSGKIRFERRSLAALREASIHHLLSYKEETMGER